MTDRSAASLKMRPRNGDDPFTHGDVKADLLGFWRWSCSDLLSNVMRGVLAEYIVGLALDCVRDDVRREWDAADLYLPDYSVEVKSSAYLQSWSQTKLSSIIFDIETKTSWHANTNTYETERKRQADVFVFCVLAHKDKATVDPLNLDQWDFYVMSTNRLNAAAGGQKTIALGSLLRHKPARASFSKLRECIEAAAQEPPVLPE
jgi:hypothetical protein